MNFILSRQASKDIEDIYLYGFIHFGEEKADLYFQEMKSFIEVLCFNPELGWLDKNMNPAIRRINFGSHVIFYDMKETILIVRILHGSMDFVRHL